MDTSTSPSSASNPCELNPACLGDSRSGVHTQDSATAVSYSPTAASTVECGPDMTGVTPACLAPQSNPSLCQSDWPDLSAAFPFPDCEMDGGESSYQLLIRLDPNNYIRLGWLEPSPYGTEYCRPVLPSQVHPDSVIERPLIGIPGIPYFMRTSPDPIDEPLRLSKLPREPQYADYHRIERQTIPWIVKKHFPHWMELRIMNANREITAALRTGMSIKYLLYELRHVLCNMFIKMSPALEDAQPGDYWGTEWFEPAFIPCVMPTPSLKFINDMLIASFDVQRLERYLGHELAVIVCEFALEAFFHDDIEEGGSQTKSAREYQ